MLTDNRDKFFGRVSDDLAAMSKVVFKQMKLVKSVMKGGSTVSERECTEEILHNELVIDGFEAKLRSGIINAIALYSPRTSDMRKLMACYDISLSLERIGDLLLNIYEYLHKSGGDMPEIYSDLRKRLYDLYELSEEMSRNAVFSFTCEDIRLARETILLDNKADVMYAEIMDSVSSFSPENLSREQDVSGIVAISSMAYNMERMADNATNISESSVYVMEGKSIIHVRNEAE